MALSQAYNHAEGRVVPWEVAETLPRTCSAS
jgi:hypothetical protein